MMKRLEVWVALGLVLLGGCLFDGSPLESRQCAEGGVCPDGQTCIEGYCVLDDFLEPDADAPDIITPPPTPDADDSQDVPPTDDVVAPPDADEPCVPTAELCDGMDNDCDDAIDEDIDSGGECEVGQGVCVASGVEVCQDGQWVCQGQEGAPSAEVCDGLDNDCDGMTDEGDDGQPLETFCYEQDSQVVGIGACQAGVRQCLDGGQMGPCVGAIYPAEERCDAVDNDCDGAVDEEACPQDIGCADGVRDGFVDRERFPTLAACSGAWAGSASLRTEAQRAEPCGDDLSRACLVAADLCAPGWTICASSGDLGPLRERLGEGAACGDGAVAGQGRWVAASSHCASVGWWGECNYYSGASECFGSGDCSEPICCGDGCASGGCADSLFGGGTRIPASRSSGCGAMPSDGVDGVLCCRTEEG